MLPVTAGGSTSADGTKRTNWAGLTMSVVWGRPEVVGWRSKWREWPLAEVGRPEPLRRTTSG